MLKRILKYAGLGLGGVALLWVVLVVAGAPLPANFLRASIERDLNQDLDGIRVSLRGPLHIIPDWSLKLRARDIVVDELDGAAPRQAARVASMDLDLSLLPLLWGEVDLQRLTARQLKLTIAKDGSGLLFPLVAGRLNFSQEGARLEDMAMELGDSRLRGSASFTGGKPPRLVIRLESPQADLEDIYAMAGLGRPREAKELALSREQLIASLDRLLRGLFGALEGELSLTARQLRLHGAPLGKARFKLTLQGRRLSLDPLVIELPGGKINFSDEIVEQGANLASQLNLSVRNFTYGVLAKGRAPKAGAGGRLSLRIALTATAPRVSQFLANANGVIQLGIWPAELKDNAYALWAANLVFGLLRSLTKHYDSKVNCAIADLVINNGVLTQRKLIIDTSKLRVSGEAKINFKTKAIEVDLTPRAKTPQFFSLETPITIQGTFDDFSAGVAPGGMVGSVIQFATSPIFAPLRRLFGDTLPAHGKDVCFTPETWPPPIAEQKPSTAK